MFSGGESDIRSVTACNTNENVNKIQEGGTARLAYGPVIDYLDLRGSNKDETGLAQRVVMTFVGSDGVKTKIVSGYNPCYNNNVLSSTSYQ